MADHAEKSSKPNRLSRAVAAADRLPRMLRTRLITTLFTTQVRFAGTGGIFIEELTEGRAILLMKNRRRVQNHLGTLHATAMALLAESATGVVFGMNIPDSCVPLLKGLQISYHKRARGDMRAEATLSPEQRERIRSEARGDLLVPVRVTDETGEEPIQVQMNWAWVPKRA